MIAQALEERDVIIYEETMTPMSVDCLKNIHINANNYGMVDNYGIPQVIEMTLINPKKFKIKNKKTKKNYPIKGLDFKNRERGRDIKIAFDE